MRVPKKKDVISDKIIKVMTNEEKLDFLKRAQALTMRYRLWDKPGIPFDKLKALDDEYWSEFSKSLLPDIPKVLYRYRPFNEYSIDELENGYVWFSHPADFDDGTDSALNTDIESEMEALEKSPSDVIVPLTRAIILQQYRSLTGKDPDARLIENGVKLWPNGKLDADAMRCTLASTCPEVNPDHFIDMLMQFNELTTMARIEKPLKRMFDHYMGINKRIRSNILCLCLAEEFDSDVMWAKYAGERSGFCIGYEIPMSNFHGQRTLMALNPIYYGEKKPMRFFDAIMDGISARTEDQIYGWTIKTYEDVHIASLTKSPEWSFQREWRVAFNPDAGGNKQSFPFVKSIYVGEKMDPLHRKKIVELARKNGWSLYERKMNKSGSKIIYQKLEVTP